jgi:PD-(D/E)XK nuclease superfamily protein
MSIIINERAGMRAHLFYRGTERLLFDEEAWKWWRDTPEGLTPLDGVTSVTKIAGSPQPLMRWAVKLALAKTKELLILGGHVFDHCNGQHVELVEAVLNDILETARKEDNAQFEEAGEVGHDAHHHLENLIRAIILKDEARRDELLTTFPEDERAANSVKAAILWMAENELEWVQTERPCYSREFGYCGTCDGIARVRGKLSCIDWKTSNSLRIGYLWQTAAYAYAYEEETGAVVENRYILRLDKETAKFDPWNVEGRELQGRDFLGFCNALRTVRSMREAEEWVSGIKDTRRAAQKVIDDAAREKAHRIACPKNAEYKGMKLTKCFTDGTQCAACKSKYEEKHK